MKQNFLSLLGQYDLRVIKANPSFCVTPAVKSHSSDMSCDLLRYFVLNWSILIMWTKFCYVIGRWVEEATTASAVRFSFMYDCW